MHIQIGILGSEEDDALIRGLKDWIDNERLDDVEVKRTTVPPVPGKMGIDPIAALSVVLSAPAIVALIGCVKSWVSQRRPEADIHFTNGPVSVTIQLRNIASPEVLLDHIEPLLKAAGKQP